MKFIKMLKFDFKEGILKNYFLFICPLLIAIPATFDTVYKINNYIRINGNKGTEQHLGNVWMAIYGGMEKYIPSPDNPFNFPIVWSVIMLIGAFLVLNYPMRDMTGVGAHYLVCGGSRKTWWISKIIWNIFATIIYHGIIILVIIVGCLVAGIDLKLNVDIGLIEYLFEFKQPVDLYYVDSIPLSVIFLPMIVAITVNIIQMMICLFINPTYSYLLNAMFAVSSAFIMNKALFYNYAIPLRYKWIFTDGVNHRNGYYIVIALLTLAIIVGMVRFVRYDIIKKENA